MLLVLDGTAFVHGGLLGGVGLGAADSINETYAQALREYFTAFDTLVTAGVLHAEDSFGERPAAAARALSDAAAAGTAIDGAVRAASARLTALTDSPLFGADAVYWDRGTVACSPAIELDRLDAALRSISAERIVVGHTPTIPRRVLTRLAGRVIRADTGMLAEYYGGEPAAVIIRNGNVEVLYPRTPGITAPDAQAQGGRSVQPDVRVRRLERQRAAAARTIALLTGQLAARARGKRSLFPTDGELPNHLRKAPIRLSSGLAARLETLTPALLDAELGDVLDERQRAAILERRDRLIDHFARD